MKVQSNNKPNNYRIKANKVILIDNITEITRINDNTEETLYEYDEYKIELANRPNLAEYVEANYDLLLTNVKEKIELEKLIPSDIEIEQAELEIKILNILSEVM